MPNIVIQASAGSGKTTQLSNRFLKILFRNIDATNKIEKIEVDTILASTFTRKAAGEITERIIKTLAKAIAGDNSEINNLKALMPNDIFNDTKNKSEIQNIINKKLFDALAQLVRNLYKVRICTLDSFFSRIASTFFLELGFPSGWSIIPDSEFEKIVNEAIHKVLENSEKNNARKLMLSIQQGDQDINVTKKLRELMCEVMPIVRESSPDAWDNHELLTKELDTNEFDDALQQLQLAELPVTKAGKIDNRFVNVRNSILTAINENNWLEILDAKIIKSIIAAENKYYNIPIEGDLLNSLRKFIVHAKAVELNKIVGITRTMRELFDLIVVEYDKILSYNQVLQFDDITNRLGDLFKLQNDKFDFQSLFQSILHRTNSNIEHLLLDEFQDTSKSQWNILKPFVNRVALSPNNTFLCVGDSKQAIYGWRGGVSEIFKEVDNVAPNIDKQTMEISYRSSQVIIDVVNKVFYVWLGLNKNEQKKTDAISSWREWMKEHKTAKDFEGHCLLEYAPESIYDVVETAEVDSDETDNDNGDDKITGYESYVVQKVIEISERKPDCSIGILVTKNAEIAKLMNEFRRRNISVSEEGGNPITDSAAVQCVLSAMQLADHPDDGVARFHLANSPLADILGLKKYDDEWIESKSRRAFDDKIASNVALKLRRDLMESGYGIVIERFVESLAPSCDQREYQRLEKLLELAYQFQENASGARTKQFIAMIKSTKVQSPSITDNIRIMTIHKSKGMQFDIVVLPFLNGSLKKNARTPNFIAGREKPTADIDLVIKYLNSALQSLLPEQPDKYRKAFSDHVKDAIKESLSVLYVAMTRAIHELVMIVKPPKIKKENAKDNDDIKYPETFEGLLLAALHDKNSSEKNNSAERTSSTILYETGNRHWSKPQSDKSKDAEKNIELDEIKIGDILSDRKEYRYVQRITPSRHTFISDETDDGKSDKKQSVESEAYEKTDRVDVIKSEETSYSYNRELAMLWGKMIHACFENWLKRREWLDDTEFDRTILSGVIEKVIRDDGYVGKRRAELNVDAKSVIDSFIEICKKPEIREVLSRRRYSSGDSVEVWHERRFLIFDDDKKQRLMKGSIDRLVVERKSGEVVNIEVLDFKTDRMGSEKTEENFLESRREFHEEQMKAYRKGVAKLYRVDPSIITVTLIFTSVGRAIPALKK
ncbi:MAG: UvrD-helicase domain-containing protein [Planctomycetaceae bacterium]|nr:UvrD-helicase domain-containing protein [Planctomycetaceae bacterium]